MESLLIRTLSILALIGMLTGLLIMLLLVSRANCCRETYL